jgi:hypothetical protein
MNGKPCFGGSRLSKEHMLHIDLYNAQAMPALYSCIDVVGVQLFKS